MCKVIKFYNNNPVEIIATKGDYSIVKLISELSEKQLYEIASQNCEGCQTGESTRCHHELNESIALDLFDVISSQTNCFFVHNNMLMDKPVEFVKYEETLALLEKAKQECGDLRAEKLSLTDELEQLQAQIDAKKRELECVETEFAQTQVKAQETQEIVPAEPIQTTTKEIAGEMVMISKKDYLDLLLRDKELSILEIDGVDSWEWYLEGYSEFVRNSARELLKPFNDQQVKQLLTQIGIKKELLLNVIDSLLGDAEMTDSFKLIDLVNLELLVKR